MGLIVLVASALLVAAGPAQATGTATLLGFRHDGGTGQNYTIPLVEDWLDKTPAVVQIYEETDEDEAVVVDRLASVWDEGSVPMLTLEPHVSNAAVSLGTIDWQLTVLALEIKDWLRGVDGVYNTSDDRRMYIRLAHEANWNQWLWAPCSPAGGTSNQSKSMWRRVHDIFANEGLSNAVTVQWVFSVNAADFPGCSKGSVENIYPGDAYVDWMGVNAYMHSQNVTVSQAIDSMVDRLRAIAPNKPVSIDEAGAKTDWGSITKETWLGQLFDYVEDEDIRMFTYFNSNGTGEWRVIGGPQRSNGPGDSTVLFGTHHTWDVFRQRASESRMLSADDPGSNVRLLTDTEFAGTW